MRSAKSFRFPMVPALLIGLAVGVASTAPALADKPEKPGKPAHAEKANPGKGDKAGSDRGGSDGGGPDGPAAALLAPDVTAAVLGQVLGLQPSAYAVGAKPLPPGIRRNLARGKPLPPGLAGEAVPQPILSRLPRVDGREWVRVGTELILVDVASRLIHQVVADVFR